jgi:hypothetical protein
MNIYILTCNNREVKSLDWFPNAIVHDLTDGKGHAHHYNVMMNEARERGEKECWMLDDDITAVYKKGPLVKSKNNTEYYSKIKTPIDLNEIIFPKGTAIGGLSKGIFPFSNSSGFKNITTCAAQIIYINLEMFDGWQLPEEPVGEVADDGEFSAYAFFRGWDVKASLDYSYKCDNSITTFDGKRLLLWYSIMNTYKNYIDQSPDIRVGFKTEKKADPRLRKAWKEMLSQGPWQGPHGKESKYVFRSELEKRNLWID